MTNNWSDIGNATLVVVMGANPVENHPASIAHVNRARFPKDFFTDARKDKQPASLIVVDPRKTRTALQCNPKPGENWDRYVRIRPGTDIAFINGVIKYITDEMAAPTTTASGVVAKYFAFLNQGGSGATKQTFYSNKSIGGSGKSVTSGTVTMGSKYTDARFLVNLDRDDYQRADVTFDGVTPAGATGASGVIYNFPKKAASVTASDDTVYNRVRAHVAPYTTATVADICGCTEDDIIHVAKAYIANSRCSSYLSPDADGNWPTGTGGEDPRNSGYRSTTMLYAMGLTQHTTGSANVKSFAQLQILMGNMGRAGGGINALRGIHNVQGSTDMGLLQHYVPGYSGNPGTQVDALPTPTNNAFGKYMDALWGFPLSGTGTGTAAANASGTYVARQDMNGSYDDAYYSHTGWWQQGGFFNMTRYFFAPTDASGVSTIVNGDRQKLDAAFALWPKGNGRDHVRMFRDMIDGHTTVCVAWGQNPAVTEPNQSLIREGLKKVKLLVVADMFETETAAADRDPGTVTILLPSASHVEKAGSATNSGRVLQWRYEATRPAGDSKDDTELLLRLAKALNDNVTGGSGFAHIKNVWTTYMGADSGIDVFENLYANQYGWDGIGDYNAVSVSGDYVTALGTTVGTAPTYNTGYSLMGSEAVAERVYRQMCSECGGNGNGGHGTLWIYIYGYRADYTNQRHTGQSAWGTYNRAKSRDNSDPNGTLAYPGWGMSWLINRRVLYNNAEIPGDIADFFMTAESQARLFVGKADKVPALLDYSRFYRTYHKMYDRPIGPGGAQPAIHVHPTTFPSHTEPYESPSDDLVATWGKNSRTVNGSYGSGIANDYMNLIVDARTDVGTPAQYPLVLTTIRCVEHFQGGPITRNNHWNAELEPEPWIEINSVDARTYGIKNGDMVNVITARSDSTTGQQNRTLGATGFAKGFRARVGAGLTENQRVGPGVVAIPWHWGDRGLSTGSRANDLCIDAGDANTFIPESKACLCKIESIES